jgi:hypothetical protein
MKFMGRAANVVDQNRVSELIEAFLFGLNRHLSSRGGNIRHAPHGSRSITTDPSCLLIATPQRLEVWPVGNGSRSIWST